MLNQVISCHCLMELITNRQVGAVRLLKRERVSYSHADEADESFACACCVCRGFREAIRPSAVDVCRTCQPKLARRHLLLPHLLILRTTSFLSYVDLARGVYSY